MHLELLVSAHSWTCELYKGPITSTKLRLNVSIIQWARAEQNSPQHFLSWPNSYVYLRLLVLIRYGQFTDG